MTKQLGTESNMHNQRSFRKGSQPSPTASHQGQKDREYLILGARNGVTSYRNSTESCFPSAAYYQGRDKKCNVIQHFFIRLHLLLLPIFQFPSSFYHQFPIMCLIKMFTVFIGRAQIGERGIISWKFKLVYILFRI